jgi:hypothetical protein
MDSAIMPSPSEISIFQGTCGPGFWVAVARLDDLLDSNRAGLDSLAHTPSGAHLWVYIKG